MRLPGLGSCAGAALLLLIGCESNDDSGSSAAEDSEAPIAEATSDELDAALEELVLPTQAEPDEAAANSIDASSEAAEDSEAPIAEAASDELDAALDELVIPTQAELDDATANSIDASNEDAEFEALWNEIMNDDG